MSNSKVDTVCFIIKYIYLYFLDILDAQSTNTKATKRKLEALEETLELIENEHEMKTGPRLRKTIRSGPSAYSRPKSAYFRSYKSDDDPEAVEQLGRLLSFEDKFDCKRSQSLK